MSLTTTDNVIPQFHLDDGLFDQETFTAAGAATYPVGLILGRLTADDKLVPYNSGGADGSQFPKALLTLELITTGAGSNRFQPAA